MASFRRQNVRYPEHKAEREATLTVADAFLPAAIIDESAGGIGVIVEELGGLAKGIVVDFQEGDEERRPARVTNVVRDQEFPVYRIGLEWC